MRCGSRKKFFPAALIFSKRYAGWINASRVSIAALFALARLSGCATIVTLTESETKNKIYSGTSRHIEAKCAHGICLDLPLSFVTDTVLLPLTAPWTLINFISHDDAKPEQPKDMKEALEKSSN